MTMRRYDDGPAPIKGKAIILPPRMRREATADSLMRESPLTLETSRKAMREMLKRFNEFQRGGAGSWKFSDDERKECLSEAIDLLMVVRRGIIETPNCTDIAWMADALVMIGRAFEYLPRIPYEGSREARLWIEHGDLADAVRDLKPFWQHYRPKFEDLHRLLHLRRLTRNSSGITANSADVSGSELDTTNWLRRCDAIEEVYKETEGCVWTRAGCGKQLDKADPSKHQCNGLSGTKRRFNPDFVRAVALKGRNKGLEDNDGED